MRRALWASILAVGLAWAQGASAAVVKIGLRTGGVVGDHVIEVTAMMASGNTFRVVGDQYSAAAMQVLFLKGQYPDRICATKKARLHFHLGLNPQTGEKMKEPDKIWTSFIGADNLKRLGKLPEYGKGFKTVKAADYLGLCK